MALPWFHLPRQLHLHNIVQRYCISNYSPLYLPAHSIVFLSSFYTCSSLFYHITTFQISDFEICFHFPLPSNYHPHHLPPHWLGLLQLPLFGKKRELYRGARCATLVLCSMCSGPFSVKVKKLKNWYIFWLTKDATPCHCGLVCGLRLVLLLTKIALHNFTSSRNDWPTHHACRASFAFSLECKVCGTRDVGQ